MSGDSSSSSFVYTLRNGWGEMLAAVLIGAFGAFFFTKAITSRRDIAASQTWPSVQGEIIDVNVSRRPGKKRGTDLDVRYRYSVDGRDFVGKRAAFAMEGSTHNDLADRWRREPRVPIYYDPQDPSRSVLLRDGQGVAESMIYIGAAGIGFGLICLGRFGYNWRKNTLACL
jgi:hypothetical protein